MSDNVSLRPKSPIANSRLVRALSRRSQTIQKMLERRQPKDDLVEKGILRPEAVFGNHLENLALDEEDRLPFFIGLCVAKIETMLHTMGIYRINGDAPAVQKLRLEVDQENYNTLEETNDVALLTSTFKLFFRELPEPLITPAMHVKTKAILFDSSSSELNLVAIKRVIEEESPELERRLMLCLFRHLRRVSVEPANLMTSRNLATVFGPNLFHCAFESRRPESMMTEFEQMARIVEVFIDHVEELFDFN